MLARATTEPSLTCVLSIPTETAIRNQSTELVLRFMTVYSKQGSFSRNAEHNEPKRSNLQSGFRVWRLKCDETTNKSVEAKTRIHLSSAPVHFSSILGIKNCYELDFVDCCMVPHFPEKRSTDVNVDMNGIPNDTSYLLAVCSTSGHVIEVSSNHPYWHSHCVLLRFSYSLLYYLTIWPEGVSRMTFVSCTCKTQNRTFPALTIRYLAMFWFPFSRRLWGRIILH